MTKRRRNESPKYHQSMENVNKNCNCDFKDMPEDILNEILLWLPVVSLLRFKSVCKSWYSLIQSSEFVSQHLLHHHYLHPTSEDDYFITLTQPDGKAVLFPRNGENYKLSDIPHPYGDNEGVELMIQVSCNGIICVYDQEGEDYSYLWNPARKQFRILPQKKWPKKLRDFIVIQFAIGFDDKTNDYKVVRLLIVDGYGRNMNNDCQLDIYSLSTDSWSVTKDIVLPVVVDHIIDSTNAPFHNGKYFCWLGEINQTEEIRANIIISFDFSNEVLGTMPLPENIICSYNMHLSPPKLAIATLRDKLVCIDLLYDSLRDWFDIWILNEFGVKDSWNKLYSIGKFQSLDYEWYYWLGGISNNRELLFDVLDGIHLCNFVTGTYEVMKNIRFPKKCLLIPQMFKESLLSIERHNVIQSHKTDGTTCDITESLVS